MKQAAFLGDVILALLAAIAIYLAATVLPYVGPDFDNVNRGGPRPTPAPTATQCPIHCSAYLTPLLVGDMTVLVPSQFCECVAGGSGQ